MWDDEEFEKKPMEEGLHQQIGETVLQSFGGFLDEYSSQLSAIQEAVSGTNELTFRPIHYQIEPEEATSIFNLINTDNKMLNKILIVFSSLCLEIQNLEVELKTQFMEKILFYGEGADDEEDSQLMISRLLPHLQDLVTFIKRCYQVALAVIQQSASFYTYASQHPESLPPAQLHIQDVLDHLGQLLLMLITLDELLTGHMTLHDHMKRYQHNVNQNKYNPARCSFDPSSIKMLSKMLKEINSTLFSGQIFQGVLRQHLDKKIQFSKTSGLVEEMDRYIRNALNEIGNKITTDPEMQKTWANICATYTFYVNLFGSTDRKLFRQFWDMSKKFPSLMLYDSVVWFPDQFLCKHLPHLSEKLVEKRSKVAMESGRALYIQMTVTNLPKIVTTFSFQVVSWIMQMESTLKKDLSHFKVEDIKVMSALFCEGIQISSNIHKTLVNLTNLHGSLAKPMTKTGVIGLCRMVELVKMVRETYMKHGAVIARSVSHIIQRLSFHALSIVDSAKKTLMSNKRFGERHVDRLSSLVVAERCLDGPATRQRLLIARIALSVANQRNTFRDDEITQLSAALHSLTQVPRLLERLEQSTDCSFLYWHRTILPVYFTAVYQSKTFLHRIKYLLEGVEDCVKNMDMAVRPTIAGPLDEEISTQLYSKLIEPLYVEVETNLRIHAHSHLQDLEIQLQDVQPDLHNILSLPPQFLFQFLFHLKGNVSNYLEETFYDLTTVALHNWWTYGEMRCLAHDKFKISTLDDNLPSQTIEQGLDVLEIMRNIHVFVSRYKYNLNNQIFIEQSSNNKHLNTINISHIANSIRTHGTGIMNTTVNFTYQYLRKKLETFSQFLYDEHIKSRLIKDLCYFRDNKTQLRSRYSFERADKFHRGIRRLGITPDGLTFLDQFRILITHIGNALGYVRMIRSGGLHCCSIAIRYIPDLDNIVSVERLCAAEGLSSRCVETARSLDLVITNLCRNLTEGSEYFKLLVDVFAPVLRDQKNSHLCNFHVIVPPLTINFCEHMVTAKEKMTKKSKEGAAFTNDGFAMGVAFLLSVLDQNAVFDSLHWFHSVRDKYMLELDEVEKQQQVVSKDDEKLHQTLNLTAKRLEIYEKEFKLLYYSLSSARVFFQRDLTSESKKSAAEPLIL